MIGDFIHFLLHLHLHHEGENFINSAVTVMDHGRSCLNHTRAACLVIRRLPMASPKRDAAKHRQAQENERREAKSGKISSLLTQVGDIKCCCCCCSVGRWRKAFLHRVDLFTDCSVVVCVWRKGELRRGSGGALLPRHFSKTNPCRT